MCLGIPALVTKVEGDVAVLDVMGTTRVARLDLVGEPVSVGQYVLHQLGFVTGVLAEGEAQETLKLFEQVLSAVSDEADPAPA